MDKKKKNDNLKEVKNTRKGEFCIRIFWVGAIVAITFVFADGNLKSNNEDNNIASVFADSHEFTADNQNNEKILKRNPDGYYDAVEAAQGIFFEIVVNSHYRLSEDFVPENLVKYKNTSLFMNGEMAENLANMIGDMKRIGLTIWVSSAYRTYKIQKYLYDNKVSRLKKQYGSKKTQKEIEIQAARIVAYPGTSEHQLGLSADLTKDGTLTEKFGASAEGKWIAENCHNYGFIIRYPKGKEHLTGIIYEPWHIRYVGIDLAKAISKSGKCLEEYFSATIPDKKEK